jgi:hypothetical protein
MNNIILGFFGGYPKTECPVCLQQVYQASMVTILGTALKGTEQKLWVGCYSCIAQVLIDHPKMTQRLAILEQKFEELNSKMRK